MHYLTYGRGMAKAETELLTIGTLSARTGVSVSAVRFYERKGLIASVRTGAGHRRFHRSTIRRLSIIVVCQRLGYPLSEIRDRLAALPTDRPPVDTDWGSLAEDFRAEIDERVERLLTLRDHLDGCIGCGCLSLDVCMLHNPNDAAASLGSGPRYLLGQDPADLPSDLPAGAGSAGRLTTTEGADLTIDEPDPAASSSSSGPTGWHLAQLNIGRLRYPVDDPRLAEFMDNLAPINALAEQSPGFVWRLQDDSGNATNFRPFDDDTILPNFSVWESLDDLKNYVFKSDHAAFLRKRREWFEPMDDLPVLTMWWIPAGHVPTLAEARERVDHLAANGPTATAFSFHPTFGPPDRAP